MKHARTRAVAIGVVALSVPGCTWVTVTEEARSVRVTTASEVSGCKKIGNVSASTTDHVTIFARSDQKVQGELESLARNEATKLDGDAIVPIGTPEEGRQSFDVYQCRTR